MWVGFIALFGVATDDAVVLMTTLDNLFKDAKLSTVKEVRDLIIRGGLLRVRPIMMTQ